MSYLNITTQRMMEKQSWRLKRRLPRLEHPPNSKFMHFPLHEQILTSVWLLNLPTKNIHTFLCTWGSQVLFGPFQVRNCESRWLRTVPPALTLHDATRMRIWNPSKLSVSYLIASIYPITLASEHVGLRSIVHKGVTPFTILFAPGKKWSKWLTKASFSKSMDTQTHSFGNSAKLYLHSHIIYECHLQTKVRVIWMFLAFSSPSGFHLAE